MRNPIVKSRWHTPRRPYSGDWRENPWFNAMDNRLQARVEVADDICRDRQQKTAIRIWEDEGGSIRTDGNLRC